MLYYHKVLFSIYIVVWAVQQICAHFSWERKLVRKFHRQPTAEHYSKDKEWLVLSLRGKIKLFLCSISCSAKTFMQVPLYFGSHPESFFFFWTSEVSFWQVEARSRSEKKQRYVDPASQDYYLVTLNVCKAIHVLQLHWSTQMHKHLQMHQSGNTTSTCLHEMYIDCRSEKDYYFPKSYFWWTLNRGDTDAFWVYLVLWACLRIFQDSSWKM